MYILQPAKWCGTNFGGICNTVNFESLDLESSLLVCGYIFRVVTSSACMKIIGSRWGHGHETWSAMPTLKWEHDCNCSDGKSISVIYGMMLPAHQATGACSAAHRHVHRHLILLIHSWVCGLHIFQSTHKLYNDKHVCVSCLWVACLRWKGDLVIIISVLWLCELQLLSVQYVVVVRFPNQHAIHRDEGAMWCSLCDWCARVWIQWRRVCACRLCSSISKLCPVHLDLCCITYSQT